MAELPWQSFSAAAPDQDCVALLSYLPLTSAWRIPRLLRYLLAIRRQLGASSGLLGYSLLARFAAKQFWTLSAWQDEAALRAFVGAPPHSAAMVALAPHMGRTRFTQWTVRGSDLPLRWDDALKREEPAGQSRA